MGKRITKNNNIPCNKKQFNNFIKFLKPKVYITSSSNFKTLVQQLTGNGNSSIVSSIHHESSVKESDHSTQNVKAMGEMSQNIMVPFENTDMINDGQAYSQIESFRESISQELSVDSSKGSILSSFTACESSIQKSSITMLDNYLENSYTTNDGQYSLAKSYQESIGQELSIDSLKGSIPSSFTASEPSIQKSFRTILDNSISYQEMNFPTEYRKMDEVNQDTMNPFDENFDTIYEGQMYSLTESESHQESINQELYINSSKEGMPSYLLTTHEPFIQKSSVAILDSSSSCQEMELSAEYSKMASWLLEIEPCSNYDSYLSNILHY